MESTPVTKEDVKNQLSDVIPSFTPVGATGMRRDHESIDDFEHLEPEPSPVKETAGKNSPELLDKLVGIEQESVSGSGRESLISGAKAPESQNSSDFSLLSDSKLDSPLAGNTPDMIEEMTVPSGSPGKIIDITNAFKTNDNDVLPDVSMHEKKSPIQQPEELSSTVKQETEKLFSKAQDLFSLQQFDTDPKSVSRSFMTTERVEAMAEGDVPKVEKSSKFSDDLEFLKYESQHEPNLDTVKMLKDPTDLSIPTELGSSLPAHVRDDLHDDDSFKDTDSLPELVKSSDRQVDILPEDPKVYKSPKEDEFEDGIEDDYDIPGLSSHIQLSDKLEQYQTKARNEAMSDNEPKKSDDLPSAASNLQHPDKEPLFTEIAKPDITPEPISKAVSEPSIKPTPLVSEPSPETRSLPKTDIKTVPPAEKHVPENIGEPSFLAAMAFVVELVYWRDPKKSGILFGSVLGILLSLSYFSLISVVAYLSLAVLTGTISYRIYKNVMQALQKTSDGHPFKDILELDLTLPQDKVREVTDTAVAHFNAAAAELRRLFLVEDLVDSIKFGILLWCLTYVGSWFNGMTLIIIAFVALFTLPKVYENNKSQIDQNLEIVRSKLAEITAKVKTFNPIAKKPPTEEKKKDN
ncbi:reticulon-1 isoform X2 [Anabrus simplex]|uniref:reticulon-1 isoform X2 n=1 Tax=Anabrus simplex TaxID=316456 RepID=UPI0035A3B471